MARYVFRLIVIAFLIWLTVAVREVRGDPIPTTPTMTDPTPAPPVAYEPPPPAFDYFVVVELKRKLRQEHRLYVSAHRRVRQLQRTLMHRTTTREAIDLACIIYGSCTTLWRRASCESHLYPLAHNRSGASGLYQFLPSTFASTPFASLSIWSPYTNALAAGWMEAHGRGGEWVCG